MTIPTPAPAGATYTDKEGCVYKFSSHDRAGTIRAFIQGTARRAWVLDPISEAHAHYAALYPPGTDASYVPPKTPTMPAVSYTYNDCVFTFAHRLGNGRILATVKDAAGKAIVEEPVFVGDKEVHDYFAKFYPPGTDAAHPSEVRDPWQPDNDTSLPALMLEALRGLLEHGMEFRPDADFPSYCNECLRTKDEGHQDCCQRGQAFSQARTVEAEATRRLASK